MSRTFAICFLLFPLTLFGQEELSILGIEFTGLKRTRANYLRSRINQGQNDKLQFADIPRYLQDLKNLTNVADASYRFDTLNQGQVLIFDIQEARTLFPIVDFGGIRDNLYYQFGFTDINWLGRGMQLSAFYRNNDRRNNFNLYFRYPNINNSRWGGSVSLLRWASREPLYFDEGAVLYNYENVTLGLTTIYEFSLGHHLEFGGSYFVENYEKLSDQSISNPPGPDALRQPKLLAKLIHHYNRIDYDFHRLGGSYNALMLETVYTILDDTWFFIMLNDFHYYLKLGKQGNLASRIRLGVSTNDDTPFAPFVLDSNINIRGSGNRIDRGTAAVIWNLEYRYDVWNRPQQDFAAQLVAFSDLGTWRNPGGDLDDLLDNSNLRHFIGGGFRLVYKNAFNAILRIDYGVDIQNFEQRGFVAGLGQYF